ncbi:MAG: thermonuclease family protein [Methyloceanibacter sp.]
MHLAAALLSLTVAAFFLWPLFIPSDPAYDQPARPEPPAPVEPEKRNLLARERAEAERLTALAAREEAAKAKPDSQRYYRVKVLDGGLLEAGGMVIKLDGIEAREADAKCLDETGKSWPCGAEARAALTRLIRSRAVTCTLPKGNAPAPFAARCSVTGTDLSTWMVRRGWAEATDLADAGLVKAAEAAKAQRSGLWRAKMEQAQP